MFTQSCFIMKNSPELREKLKKLGYHVYDLDMNKDSPAEWCTVIESEAGYAGIWNKEPKNKAKFLDCGENEQLFLALAALRDDTDSDQWFILDYNDTWPEAGDFRSKGDFVYCNTEKYYCGTDVRIAHKATPEELIKHFNHE